MDDSQLWAAIEAAGPLTDNANFDPLLVDDVLQAERSATQYDRRRAFIASYAWAIPTREAIGRIAAAVGERQIIEVGAGLGLWAKLLSDAGVAVVATDGAPALSETWYPVEVTEAEAAVERHIDCQALLLCWPPFKDACAFRALRAFEGDRLIYIGDVRFTADTQFYELLRASWELVESLPLPSWPGTSDGVYVYARK